MAYLQKDININPEHWAALRPWLAATLAVDPILPNFKFPLGDAEQEGVLPWLAYCLQNEQRQRKGFSPTPEQIPKLRDSLRRWNLIHLSSESELERLVHSAAERELRFLAFKGHSVARTLYPHPACRPTSDFDLLIRPDRVVAAQAWLRELGYSPLQNFIGIQWLGAQSWVIEQSGKPSFHVDLHWDYTNRMYFRNRLPFEQIWATSREVPCGDAKLRVPCQVDDLIFACVHLAALDPGFPLRLNWLLDIYLLMASFDRAKTTLLIERAQLAHATEACLVFGQLAARLGDEPALEPVIQALQANTQRKRMKAYNRTLRRRWLDLSGYWLRLPIKEKAAFFGDLFRWIRVR